MDDLIKQLRDMMYRMSWDDAKKLGEIIAALDGSTLATSKANAALEAAKARITALESERATLLHDVEIHARQPVYAYVYEYETAFGLHRQLEPGTYNGSEPARTVKVYAAPPSQLDTRWIDVNDRLPEIDYSKPAFDRQVVVLASWGGDKVAEMRYVSHGYAKREKGRAPRFEWQGRISPWLVTHWMPLPEAPANQKQAGQ